MHYLVMAWIALSLLWMVAAFPVKITEPTPTQSKLLVNHGLPNSMPHATPLYFKPQNDEQEIEPELPRPGFLQRLRTMIPVRRTKEHYQTPKPDTRMRYHVRLVNPEPRYRRHVITRLLRYLPDISYPTAAEIVDTALDNGRSLVRVTGSLDEAMTLVDLLRRAFPPVRAEVYDAKEGDILSL